MNYFKNFLSLTFLLFTINSTHAKSVGRSPQRVTQPVVQPQTSPAQVASKSQQPMSQPKTYADALVFIRTKMLPAEVLVNNTFTQNFIDFVKSLKLSDIETEALLQAGINLHATWTGDNENDRRILTSLKNTIQRITQAKPITPAQPTIQHRPAEQTKPTVPTRPALPSKPLPQPSLPKPTEQPKKAISIEPKEQAIPTIKPIMPQQQLFAQKDALQNLVKNVWENCLKALDENFVDFLGKDDQYNIVIIQGGFEKFPKTNDDIIFIKNTVKNIIAKTQTSSIKFDQKTKDSQELALKSLLEGIVTNALIELVLQDQSKALFWCTCHPEYKRLTLILLLINDIRERFPNKNQQIVYTSFASGSLLLDYVALSELLLSHTHILVNLIDLLYPDVPTLPGLKKKDLSAQSPRELHKLQMKNAQEQADIIDSFKTKIAQIVSEKPANTNYNFDVNVYQNAYDYITYVQKNPKEKSNVLLLVDPNIGTFGMADFPALANVINVWVDEEAQDEEADPAFIIFLPRHQGVHLYQKKENNSPQIMPILRSQLLSLMKTTGIDKNYSPKFTNELLDRKMFDGQQITDDLLTKNFPKLMEIRSKLKNNALTIGYLDSDLLNPLTPIKLGDVPVLLSWGTDAHISFQDLVWDALASNAAVYEMYMIDPNNEEESNIQIIKVNPEAYKKADVVTPNSGKDLVTMDENKQPEDLMEKIAIK